MGTKYTTQSASGYNSSPPADDGTQVASNLITWAGVKTKLADPIKMLADAENAALVAALDLSARAISSPDTAIASDHWKTLQVTGTTTVTLSSAASMGAGYEVGIFNAGVGVVTVTPGAASDTINGLSASVMVSIKGTKIFRTNQALTGYNVVGGYDPQTVTATTSVVTPLIQTISGPIQFSSASGAVGPNSDNTTSSGSAALRWASIFTPTIDTGTTGSGTLKTNGGTTVLTWANDLSVKPVGLLDLTTATAGQIGFPAAQNASAGANVLDDYEEGTWTPNIGGSATYTLQSGTYTKIGRLVFFRGDVTINVIGTGATTTISGLPFAAAAATLCQIGANSSATSIVSASGSVTTGSTVLITSRTAASTGEASNAIFQNGTSVSVAGCYQV